MSDHLCQSAVSWFFFSRGAIVHQSGLLDHLVAGDMIIQNIVAHGVDVHIPPFLKNGTFTESEAKATKAIAEARTHVERADARLKDF